MVQIAIYKNAMKNSIRKIFSYIGIISMDLYFVHMFFIEYLTKEYVYSLTDSIQMYVVVFVWLDINTLFA